MIAARTYPDYSMAPGGSIARLDLWLAVGLSGLVLTALGLGGQGQLLRVAIPVAGALVALVLYLRRPIVYIQYTLWVWFLCPLIRRLVDWRFGWTDPNFILVTPLLVSGVAGLTMLRRGSNQERGIPPAFVLCGIAILYGFVVGMVLKPSFETVYGLFNWMCPLLFGLHLFKNWRFYQEQRDAISRTFLWAVLLLGAYGILQFFSPPDWDIYWLTNVQYQSINPAFGGASDVRVWSTLNSPGPFANLMMAGLLLLFNTRSRLKVPAAMAGYVSFLLSMVRTAWLSWFVGMFAIIRKTNSKALVRMVLLITLLLGCLVPVVNDSRLLPGVGDRLNTFSDLSHDESLDARLNMYRTLLERVAITPFGQGLSNETMAGNIPIDSGIVSMLFSLGWLGSFVFLAGTVAVFWHKAQSSAKGDSFLTVSKSIAIAILVQLAGGNIFVNVTGTALWLFAAMYLAGRRYYVVYSHTS